jgi:AhpD family alkylhydroperoxidase
MYNDLMLAPSGLSKLEREMIAVAVSSHNRCYYCLVAHGAAVRQPSAFASDAPRPSSRLAVIDAVWPHVGRGCDPVRHIEKAGNGGDVPDIARSPKPARRKASRSASSTLQGSADSFTAKSSIARSRGESRAAR